MNSLLHRRGVDSTARTVTIRVMAVEKIPHDPEWTLGDRLAKARAVAGLTQREIADKIGVSSAAVAKWETDAGEPRHLLELAEQWSEITGVSVVWLLGAVRGANAHVSGDAHNPGSGGPAQLGSAVSTALQLTLA